MTPQRKRTLATVMVIVLAAPALIAAMAVLRKTGGTAVSNRRSDEAVVFEGAAGWTGARGPCTEVRPEDHCDSEWRHESGQVARVFIIDVPDKAALDNFVGRLEGAVQKNGGLTERIPQGELTLVRFLQPAPGGLATLNYALTSDKLRALHLVTSVVPYDEQQTADARLRGLLERAVWSTPQG
ncbi:MAG: hypothetical protein IT382_05540 [Deltaproteobacteria bacterium]|nr:hypothetical protein [Deltaproteobacteria bacterium]